MEHLTDAQIVARLRQNRRYRPSVPFSRLLPEGWDYKKAHAAVLREGRGKEFGIGTRRPRRKAVVA